MNEISGTSLNRLVRILLGTSMAAFGTYLSTGFPSPYLTGFFFLTHLSLFVFGPKPNIAPFVAPLGSLFFFLLGISHYWQGKPIIVVLANFASGILTCQSLLMTDLPAIKRSIMLSTMLVFASSAMNVNFLLPVVLFPFIFLLIMSLSSIAVYEQKTLVPEKSFLRGKRGPFHFSLHWVTVFLVFWLGLFYFFPRGETFGLSAMTGQRRLMGFSDTLRLGESGSLHDNADIVMRVKPLLPDPISAEVKNLLKTVYLRGCSFMSYRQGAWKRDRYSSIQVNMRKNRGEVRLRNFENDSRPDVVLEILLENTDPPVMFLPDQAQTVSTDLPALTVESDGAVSFSQRRPNVETYRTLIKLGRPDIKALPSYSSYSFPPFLKPFLDTGDLSFTVKEEAERVTAKGKNLLESVQAIDSFLNRTCEYSLYEDMPTGIRDPVAYFLFQSHRGTCEHYASAMTLMLRAIGIPARPVNGYRLDEWNKFGRYFTVRQSDAHSWVEVYYPEKGWMLFDPTPASPDQTTWMEENFSPLVELWYRFEAFWLSFVYSYDQQSQATFFKLLRSRLGGFFSFLYKTGSLFVFFMIGLFLLTILAYKTRISAREQKCDSESWLPLWYRDWTRSFPEPRHPWETPREFHSRLVDSGQIPRDLTPQLETLSRLVHETAFGEPQSEGIPEGIRLIRELKKKTLLR